MVWIHKIIRQFYKVFGKLKNTGYNLSFLKFLFSKIVFLKKTKK